RRSRGARAAPDVVSTAYGGWGARGHVFAPGRPSRAAVGRGPWLRLPSLRRRCLPRRAPGRRAGTCGDVRAARGWGHQTRRARVTYRGGSAVSVFTQRELAFLASQRLGRLATVSARGEPHVVPVAFRHNPLLDSIDVGGTGLPATRKYRDVAATGRAAFVVDDDPGPGKGRGMEGRGRAEVLPAGGQELDPRFGP